jgi:hypothetical protein
MKYWVATFFGLEEDPARVVLFEDLEMVQVRRLLNMSRQLGAMNSVWLEMPNSPADYRAERLNHWRRLAAKD